MTFTALVRFNNEDFTQVAKQRCQDGARGAALMVMAHNAAATEMVIEDDSIADGDKVVERWYSNGVRMWPV